MTAYDEELAALLALDALAADEQADAELRLGTFPAGFRVASAELAEAAAAPPPAELRDVVLTSALRRRPAGRPVDAPPQCPPVEAFTRTIADLYQLLTSLSDADWEATAHPEHGSVKDLIAHLVGVERLALRWLDPADDVPLLPDHVAATRATVAQLTAADARDVAEQWHEAALNVAAAARAGDLERPVTFHDITATVTGFLVMRTFELWAHATDVCAATGRPLPELDPARMALMSARLMAAVPLALAYRRTSAPGRTARFVLTGASGGCYTVPLHPGDEPGEPDVTLVADTVDLCRVAARRLRPDDLAATIDGDTELADLVLASLDAFARD